MDFSLRLEIPEVHQDFINALINGFDYTGPSVTNNTVEIIPALITSLPNQLMNGLGSMKSSDPFQDMWIYITSHFPVITLPMIKGPLGIRIISTYLWVMTNSPHNPKTSCIPKVRKNGTVGQIELGSLITSVSNNPSVIPSGCIIIDSNYVPIAQVPESDVFHQWLGERAIFIYLSIIRSFRMDNPITSSGEARSVSHYLVGKWTTKMFNMSSQGRSFNLPSEIIREDYNAIIYLKQPLIPIIYGTTDLTSFIGSFNIFINQGTGIYTLDTPTQSYETIRGK